MPKAVVAILTASVLLAACGDKGEVTQNVAGPPISIQCKMSSAKSRAAAQRLSARAEVVTTTPTTNPVIIVPTPRSGTVGDSPTDAAGTTGDDADSTANPGPVIVNTTINGPVCPNGMEPIVVEVPE